MITGGIDTVEITNLQKKITTNESEHRDSILQRQSNQKCNNGCHKEEDEDDDTNDNDEKYSLSKSHYTSYPTTRESKR